MAKKIFPNDSITQIERLMTLFFGVSFIDGYVGSVVEASNFVSHVLEVCCDLVRLLALRDPVECFSLD